MHHLDPLNRESAGFVDPLVIAKALRLTPGERQRLVDAIAADPKTGGMRSDGLMPLASAVRFCRAARD